MTEKSPVTIDAAAPPARVHRMSRDSTAPNPVRSSSSLKVAPPAATASPVPALRPARAHAADSGVLPQTKAAPAKERAAPPRRCRRSSPLNRGVEASGGFGRISCALAIPAILVHPIKITNSSILSQVNDPDIVIRKWLIYSTIDIRWILDNEGSSFREVATERNFQSCQVLQEDPAWQVRNHRSGTTGPGLLGAYVNECPAPDPSREHANEKARISQGLQFRS